MHFILGNGLIGLLAGRILSRKVIPFGRSRFYSFETPLADDHIVFAEDVASAVHSSPRILNNPKMSLGGKLFEPTPELRSAYLNKVGMLNLAVGDSIKAAMTLNATCTELYRALKKEIDLFDVKIIGIKPGVLILTDGSTIPYSSLISTIPLNELLRLLKMQMTLECCDVYCCHLGTMELNLEGAQQVFVLDEHIEFFKVNQVRKNEYVLFSFQELDELIIGKYIKDFKILEKTKIPDAMPLGVPPSLNDLEAMNIRCIGSCAQWDEAMDVSSCLRRILKIR